MMNNNRILARDGVTPSIYVSCVRTLQCDVNTRFIMMPAALLSADTSLLTSTCQVIRCSWPHSLQFCVQFDDGGRLHLHIALSPVVLLTARPSRHLTPSAAHLLVTCATFFCPPASKRLVVAHKNSTYSSKAFAFKYACCSAGLCVLLILC